MCVNVNGNLKGYFKYKQGMKQEDSLSHLLFCLAEEVLSKGILDLVSKNCLKLISASRNYLVPSRIFYVDDITIFYKGNKASIEVIEELFNMYTDCFGQCITNAKSIMYAGAMSA